MDEKELDQSDYTHFQLTLRGKRKMGYQYDLNPYYSDN
jgi:hypothetical protein